VDRVHGRWTTTGSRGPPWTGGGADDRTSVCGGILTEVWPPSTPEHESSPVRAQQREDNMGNPSRASLKLGRRCGGRATVMKWRRRDDLVAAVFELAGRGKVEGGGWEENWQGGLLLLWGLEGGGKGGGE
jgi:hypothetical protein